MCLAIAHVSICIYMKSRLQVISTESSSDGFVVSSDPDDDDDDDEDEEHIIAQNDEEIGDQQVVPHVDEMAFARFFQFMRETNLMMAILGAGDVVFDLEDDSDDEFEEEM